MRPSAAPVMSAQTKRSADEECVAAKRPCPRDASFQTSPAANMSMAHSPLSVSTSARQREAASGGISPVASAAEDAQKRSEQMLGPHSSDCAGGIRGDSLPHMKIPSTASIQSLMISPPEISLSAALSSAVAYAPETPTVAGVVRLNPPAAPVRPTQLTRDASAAPPVLEEAMKQRAERLRGALEAADGTVTEAEAEHGKADAAEADAGATEAANANAELALTAAQSRPRRERAMCGVARFEAGAPSPKILHTAARAAAAARKNECAPSTHTFRAAQPPSASPPLRSSASPRRKPLASPVRLPPPPPPAARVQQSPWVATTRNG